MLYTGEAWRDAPGGLHTGLAFLDKLDLFATANARALDASWLTAAAELLVANGHGLSQTLVGDAQGVSSIQTRASSLIIATGNRRQRLPRQYV